ncbi:MAG: RNA polymerase sigma factor [Opitutaceae bacterium]|nr:RNA polymerase sigma factor [Opitutaceae bacterium]
MADQAFTQLVDSHYAALYRFALSLARSEADACDLVQQTFYVWAKKGHALRDGAKVKTWLFTTLYREFLRVRRRGARVSALADLPVAESDPADEETDLALKFDTRLVVEALQQVDENHRTALTLFYLEDMAYQEMADMLEVPIGTVMSRLSRGKAQLRVVLARAEAGKVLPFPDAMRRSGAEEGRKL